MYLAEAHAADTWPLSNNCLNAHSNITHRLAAARSFLTEYPELASVVDEMYVDFMDDKTTVNNGLWPERYLLLDGRTVQWASSSRFEDRFVDIPGRILEAATSLWKV